MFIVFLNASFAGCQRRKKNLFSETNQKAEEIFVQEEKKQDWIFRSTCPNFQLEI